MKLKKIKYCSSTSSYSSTSSQTFNIFTKLKNKTHQPKNNHLQHLHLYPSFKKKLKKFKLKLLGLKLLNLKEIKVKCHHLYPIIIFIFNLGKKNQMPMQSSHSGVLFSSLRQHFPNSNQHNLSTLAPNLQHHPTSHANPLHLHSKTSPSPRKTRNHLIQHYPLTLTHLTTPLQTQCRLDHLTQPGNPFKQITPHNPFALNHLPGHPKLVTLHQILHMGFLIQIQT